MRKFMAAILPFAVVVSGPALAQAPQAAAPAHVAQDALVGAAIYVWDLPRALKFYRDTLGMRVLMQFNPPGAQDKSRPDTVLSFGNGPNDSMLMLLSDRDPSGPRKIEHAFGFARVVLRMGELDRVAAKLRANGFAAGEIRSAHDTLRVMMVTDPDGYTVEIIER